MLGAGLLKSLDALAGELLREVDAQRGAGAQDLAQLADNAATALLSMLDLDALKRQTHEHRSGHTAHQGTAEAGGVY